jgi:anti-sigma B factor antagonist
MPLQIVSNGDDYEFVVVGRVDGEMANELEIALIHTIKEGARSIAIDMAETNFLCSAGIRVLLQYARQMRNAGKRLVVSCPSREVKAVFDSTGFANMILDAPDSR